MEKNLANDPFSSLLLLEDTSMEVSVYGSIRQRWAW